LAAELEQEMPVLTQHILQNGEPEEIGAKVRDLLGVPLSLQKTWRDPRKSYNTWRAHIESAGALVFQVAGVMPKEILGFSIKERPLPVIAVNRKVAPNGRTFTLLHELAHILLDESAICDVDEDESRPPEEQHKEVFCNAIAAAVLVPREALLAEDLVTSHPANLDAWTDSELDSLARTFSVSTHVILRRLLTEGRTTKTFYAAHQDMWRTMLQPPKDGVDSDDKFRRNLPQEVVSDLGRPFTRLVLDSYENSRMSLSDVSRFLGIRAERVEKVREIMSRS
jgi:Zn-dependent peptidase ImmA (M78 family)